MSRPLPDRRFPDRAFHLLASEGAAHSDSGQLWQRVAAVHLLADAYPALILVRDTEPIAALCHLIVVMQL